MKKILSIFVFLIFILSSSTEAFEMPTFPELVVYVNDLSQATKLYQDSKLAINKDKITFESSSKISEFRYDRHKAIAIPYELRISKIDLNMFFKEGIRVYIYGEHSIREHWQKLNIEKDYIPVVMEDIEKTGAKKQIKIKYLNLEAEEKKFDVISFKNEKKSYYSKNLLGMLAEKNEIKSIVKLIYNDYLSTRLKPDKDEIDGPIKLSAVLDKSNFSIDFISEFYRNFDNISQSDFEFEVLSQVKLDYKGNGKLRRFRISRDFPRTTRLINYQPQRVKTNLLGTNSYKLLTKSKKTISKSELRYLQNISTSVDKFENIVNFDLNDNIILGMRLRKADFKTLYSISTNRKILNFVEELASDIRYGHMGQYPLLKGRYLNYRLQVEF